MPSTFFATTNLVDVFLRCDPAGQVITGGLAIASVIAWWVMISKRNELVQLRRLNLMFENRLRDERTLLDLPESYRNKRGIPYAALFADAMEAYARAASIGKERGSDTSAFRLEHTENALQRALASEILRYESSMVFLASIVSGAPFLGLLGTVWGVMETFSDVATAGSANLAAMAPGVSAALITTVTGLLVAIPAMFGYNYLVTTLRGMIVELDNFAGELSSEFEHKYVEHRAEHAWRS